MNQICVKDWGAQPRHPGFSACVMSDADDEPRDCPLKGLQSKVLVER